MVVVSIKNKSGKLVISYNLNEIFPKKLTQEREKENLPEFSGFYNGQNYNKTVDILNFYAKHNIFYFFIESLTGIWKKRDGTELSFLYFLNEPCEDENVDYGSQEYKEAYEKLENIRKNWEEDWEELSSISANRVMIMDYNDFCEMKQKYIGELIESRNTNQQVDYYFDDEDIKNTTDEEDLRKKLNSCIDSQLQLTTINIDKGDYHLYYYHNHGEHFYNYNWNIGELMIGYYYANLKRFEYCFKEDKIPAEKLM